MHGGVETGASPAVDARARRRRLAYELYLQPVLAQRGRLMLIAVSLAILSGSIAVVLYAVKWMVPALFAPSGGAAKAAWVVPLLGIPVAQESLATAVPVVLVVAGICRSFALYLYSLEQQALALEWARHYRERLFDTVLALPYVRIRKRSPGEWMSLAMNDVNFMQNRLTDALAGVLRGGAQVLTGFVVLFSVHWPSALLLVAASPLVSFGMGRVGRRIARYTELFQRELGRIAAAVLDLRGRFDFIRAQGGEARERERFAQLNKSYYRMIRRSILIRSTFAPLLELVGFVSFAAFTWALARRHLDVEPGDMLRFFAALGILLKPLRELGEQISRAQETRGVLRQTLALFEDLDEARPISRELGPAQGTASSHKGVRIESLEIAYAGRGGAAFAASALELRPGRSVAVIGPSGAGKSTLLKALGGLIEPRRWECALAWRELARSTSMVSQEPFLFDDTIAENLAYGLQGAARPSEAAMWEALATVNVDSEVRATAGGLSARVRAIGSNLSGGQLQRLTIARGLLRQRAIWLLDEATSAIDARSEREITLRLTAACRKQGTMLVAVTHRLQWLDAYDEVWFVENGTVTHAGEHKRLLEEPRYRQFCAEERPHVE